MCLKEKEAAVGGEPEPVVPFWSFNNVQQMKKKKFNQEIESGNWSQLDDKEVAKQRRRRGE